MDSISEQARTDRNAFRRGVSERIDHYVYLLIDPRTDEVFYVGKGQGNRCFAHIAEARSIVEHSDRDYSKLSRVREIEAAGGEVRVDILCHGLSEREAFLVESASIDLLELFLSESTGFLSEV